MPVSSTTRTTAAAMTAFALLAFGAPTAFALQPGASPQPSMRAASTLHARAHGVRRHNGTVQLSIVSNGKKAVVSYKLGKRKHRKVTRARATVTLPKGSRAIRLPRCEGKRSLELWQLR